AGLQAPFAGAYSLTFEGEKPQARIQIWKNGDELWADLVEHLGVPPDTSPDCPDGTLGQAGCPPFGATPRGTRVYYEARIPREFRGGRLIVSKGGTAITLEANLGDGGFSGPELVRAYAMIDSLTLVTTDELRRYHRNFMDNLR